MSHQNSAPFTADHVAYVFEPGEVTALYIPNADHARNPKATLERCRQDIAWWRANNIQVIGSVYKLGRAWHWEGPNELDPFPDHDPTRKEDATRGLREAVAAYFSSARHRP